MFSVGVMCMWSGVLLLCVGLFPLGCSGQLTPEIDGKLVSVGPGPFVPTEPVRHGNKTGHKVRMGVIATIPGGAYGWTIPTQQGDGLEQLWCIAAGTRLALFETNASPSLLPGHPLELVYGDDLYNPSKSGILAQEMLVPEQNISLIIGGYSTQITKAIAAEAKFYNKPYVTSNVDETQVTTTEFPQLLSFHTPVAHTQAVLAEYVRSQGWERVATLSSLDINTISLAAQFAVATSRLNISIATRQTYDDSFDLLEYSSTGFASSSSSYASGHVNPSLETAVSELRTSDVRIMYISCTTANLPGIFEALNRGGLVGEKYQYMGPYDCFNGLPAALLPLEPRFATWLRGVIVVNENNNIPISQEAYQQFQNMFTQYYQQSPEQVFNCDASRPTTTPNVLTGYNMAMTAIIGLDAYIRVKDTCNLPSNIARFSSVINMTSLSSHDVNCSTLMSTTTWNDSLGVSCCLLNSNLSSYARLPDPFGFGGYVGGDGPVLLSALQNASFDSVLGQVGVQTSSHPYINVVLLNYYADPKTQQLSIQTIGAYTVQTYQETTHTYTWNKQHIVPAIYFDGTSKPVDDGVIRVVTILHPNSGLRISLLILSILLIIKISFLSILLFTYRSLRAIKSASITFQLLMGIGACFVLSSIATLYDETDNMCRARTFMGHIGFAILFGSLFVKTFRLACIFSNRAFRVRAHSDVHLLCYLCVYVGVVLIFLIIWMKEHTPHVTFRYAQDHREGYYTCTSTSYREMWILLGLHSAMLLWGIYLCIRLQHVFAELDDSKPIGLSIWNVSFICGIVVALDQGLNLYQVDMEYIVYSMGILIGVSVTMALLFIPKLQAIHGYRQKGATKATPLKRQSLTSGGRSQGDGDLNKKVGGSDGLSREHGSMISTSSGHMSDLGLNVTSSDWLKLRVFIKKSYAGVQGNNFQQLVMAHNQLHSLLEQIYTDASKQNNNKNNNNKANNNALEHKETWSGTPLNKRASSSLPSAAHTESNIQVNEQGVRVSLSTSCALQHMFLQHRGELGLPLGQEQEAGPGQAAIQRSDNSTGQGEPAMAEKEAAGPLQGVGLVGVEMVRSHEIHVNMDDIHEDDGSSGLMLQASNTRSSISLASLAPQSNKQNNNHK